MKHVLIISAVAALAACQQSPKVEPAPPGADSDSCSADCGDDEPTTDDDGDADVDQGDDLRPSDPSPGDVLPGGDDDPDPTPHKPLYIVAFAVAYLGQASDEGELWVDLRVGDASAIPQGWRLMSASFVDVDVQMLGSDVAWALADGDVLRFHGPEYPGTTDAVKTQNHPDKWDYTASGGFVPSFKHGLLWLEDAAGAILDLVAYETDSNDGDWLSGAAMAPLEAAVAAFEWDSTSTSGALQLGDSGRNFGRLVAPGRDGNAASDWEAAGAASPYYYEAAEGVSGASLAVALNSIIKGHTVVPYEEAAAAFSTTDRDPNDPTRIREFYTGQSTVSDFNREHVWAKSHGGFSADSMIGYSDLHNLRPSRPDINSKRWHLDFDEGGVIYSNTECRVVEGVSFEPRDAVKGEVARTLFYMAVRYDGDDGNMPDLVLVDAIPSLLNASGQPDNNQHVETPHHGRLSTLLAWHVQDPPDDEERRRNDVIHESLQHNRNPFVDHPEWVHEIWGGPAWPY